MKRRTVDPQIGTFEAFEGSRWIVSRSCRVCNFRSGRAERRGEENLQRSSRLRKQRGAVRGLGLEQTLCYDG